MSLFVLIFGMLKFPIDTRTEYVFRKIYIKQRCRLIAKIFISIVCLICLFWRMVEHIFLVSPVFNEIYHSYDGNKCGFSYLFYSINRKYALARKFVQYELQGRNTRTKWIVLIKCFLFSILNFKYIYIY